MVIKEDKKLWKKAEKKNNQETMTKIPSIH